MPFTGMYNFFWTYPTLSIQVIGNWWRRNFFVLSFSLSSSILVWLFLINVTGPSCPRYYVALLCDSVWEPSLTHPCLWLGEWGSSGTCTKGTVYKMNLQKILINYCISCLFQNWSLLPLHFLNTICGIGALKCALNSVFGLILLIITEIVIW